jgi:hypothetical protein
MNIYVDVPKHSAKKGTSANGLVTGYAALMCCNGTFKFKGTTSLDPYIYEAEQCAIDAGRKEEDRLGSGVNKFVGTVEISGDKFFNSI